MTLSKASMGLVMFLTAKRRRMPGVNVMSHSRISASSRPDCLKCSSIILPLNHSSTKLGPQFEMILDKSSFSVFVGLAGFSTNAGRDSSTAAAVSITRLCIPTKCASLSFDISSRCPVSLPSRNGCSFL